MGLDAQVYCDCVEKRRLLIPLPENVIVTIDEDGYPSLTVNGEGSERPDWSDFPCAHEGRRLLHQRLGNISLIGLLRSELNRETDMFPVLIQKILYCGTHCGDYLSADIFPALQQELARLKSFKCIGNVPAKKPFGLEKQSLHYTSAEDADAFMLAFRNQMLSLIDAALSVNKPIVF